MPKKRHATDGDDLALTACPNPDCDRFNQSNAGNLSVCEWMGKDKAIRRLYCNHCQQLDRLRAVGNGLDVVELDELHGRICRPPREKGSLARSRMGGGILDRIQRLRAADSLAPS